MNSSLLTADSTTHLKILVVALVAGISVVWIGISVRSTAANTPLEDSRIERSISKPGAPGTAPRNNTGSTLV
jgi:hypothetical protein